MSDFDTSGNSFRRGSDQPVLLLMEHDPGDRVQDVECLAQAGFVVLAADTVEQIQELARQQTIDAVLVDGHFVRNHSEVLKFLRNEGGSEPVQILLTEFRDEQLAGEAIQAGIRHFVSKSPDYVDLLPFAISNIVEIELLRVQSQTRRAEFLNMIESMPDVVLLLSREGKIQYINRQAEHVWHRTPQEMIGEYFGMPIVAGEATEVEFYDHENKTIRLYEMRTAEVEFDCRPALMVCMRDQTDRKKIEDDLSTALRRADAANQLKTQFMANLTHEVRTPISSILGYAGLLTENPKDFQNAIAAIQLNAHRLLDYFTQVLDFSELGAGRLLRHNSGCSPWRILQEVVSSHQADAIRKQITLSLAASGQIPASMFTDPDLVKKILNTALSNAIKFSSGGQKVDVQLRVDQMSRHLCFKICDEGIGMTDDTRSGLFKPFEQGDGSFTRQYEGSGMSLSVAKRLALVLHGDLCIQSAIGKGTVFQLLLPLPQTDEGKWLPGEQLDPSILDRTPQTHVRQRSDLANLFHLDLTPASAPQVYFKKESARTTAAIMPILPEEDHGATAQSLQAALHEHSGDLLKTAEALGMSVSQLYRSIKRFGITI